MKDRKTWRGEIEAANTHCRPNAQFASTAFRIFLARARCDKFAEAKKRFAKAPAMRYATFSPIWLTLPHCWPNGTYEMDLGRAKSFSAQGSDRA